MIKIRRARKEDYAQIWPILQEVFAQGDTYVYLPGTDEKEAYHLWMEVPLAVYVAVEEDRVCGTYYIKPNQPGLGSHVCNAGYAVGAKDRGKGIGRLMCEHSLREAQEMGFLAMQYNFVVSTNHVAVKLWKSCGFDIVGVLPKAFNHSRKGLVDAYVMYRWFN